MDCRKKILKTRNSRRTVDEKKFSKVMTGGHAAKAHSCSNLTGFKLLLTPGESNRFDPANDITKQPQNTHVYESRFHIHN